MNGMQLNVRLFDEIIQVLNNVEGKLKCQATHF